MWNLFLSIIIYNFIIIPINKKIIFIFLYSIYPIYRYWGLTPLWWLRIIPCFALSQFVQIFAYFGIYIPLLSSHWGRSQGLSLTYEQAHISLNLFIFELYIWCWGQKPPTAMLTDCSVLRTPTISPNIRISWNIHPTFMLTSGQVSRPFTYLWASSCGFRPFDPGIIYINYNYIMYVFILVF